MTITRRIGFVVAVLVLLTVVAGGIGLGAEMWMKTWSSGYKETAAQVAEAAKISAGSSSMVAYGLAHATATYDITRAEFEALWKEDRAQVSEALSALGAMESEEAQDSTELADMADLFDRCSQALEATVQMSITDSEAALAEMDKTVLPLARQLGLASDDYLKNEQAQERAAVDELNDRIRLVMIVTGGVLGLSVLAGVVLALRLTRRIRRQLGAATSGIGTSAAELLAVSSQVAASAAQTAASTNETTATVEEVKQTALLAHEKAEQVAESSQNVALVAEAGRATVEETMAAFEQMQDQMGVVAGDHQPPERPDSGRATTSSPP